MSAEQESGARSAGLQQPLTRVIARQIVHRTCGRVQALEVEVGDNRVIVRGRAPSYYVEQLALQGGARRDRVHRRDADRTGRSSGRPPKPA